MPSGVFDTADGQINITMIRDVDWKPYCESIERTDLLTDPRFETMAKRRENIEELYATVRPVLKALDQHLYVLSTLALALMIQQFTAIEWSTEPQPFPALIPIDPSVMAPESIEMPEARAGVTAAPTPPVESVRIRVDPIKSASAMPESFISFLSAALILSSSF